MKALSVMQPWAWGITIAKPIENRTWAPPHTLRVGELFAIHASKAYDHAASSHPAMRELIYNAHDDSEPWRITGAVVGVATFKGAHRAGACTQSACLGWGAPDDPDGRPVWHWEVDGSPLPEPVLCLGALGIWVLPMGVEAAVLVGITKAALR